MPTPHPARSSLTWIGLVLAAGLALSACGTSDQADSAETTASPSTADTQHSESAGDGHRLVAEVDAPVEFAVCEQAEAIEGATVEWLDDVVVDEQVVAAVEAKTLDFDGQEIELPGAPEIVVPERVAQAGCIIEYPAPGGCLPAVEISGAYIPGYRVPSRTMPGVELPDGTVLEELTQEGYEVEPVQEEAVREDQVCQVEPDDAQEGDVVSYVVRPHLHRPWMLTPVQTTPLVNTPPVTSESGVYVAGRSIPGHSARATVMPAALVAQGLLEQYFVEGTEHTEFSERDEVTAYTTQGDVLFDSDVHELRDDAATELQAIADDIATREDDVTIRIEGHTDDLPSQRYTDNSELSELRAEAVKQWLVDNTEIDAAAVSTEGLGDEHPRASNTSDAGRQENRRVVITVMPKDYEPSIDYELDDSEAPNP